MTWDCISLGSQNGTALGGGYDGAALLGPWPTLTSISRFARWVLLRWEIECGVMEMPRHGVGWWSGGNEPVIRSDGDSNQRLNRLDPTFKWVDLIILKIIWFIRSFIICSRRTRTLFDIHGIFFLNELDGLNEPTATQETTAEIHIKDTIRSLQHLSQCSIPSRCLFRSLLLRPRN